ncbi:MAG: peptidase, partial [Planctomycetota bacterium]
FSTQGAMVTADLDPEHWLSFGLGERLPVLIAGSYAFLSMHPVATPARLGDADTLRLSGLLWPEARERWARSAYATVERVGAGQVILFASDPFFRGYFEGSGRLLQNAILLGPGLGASPPVPW